MAFNHGRFLVAEDSTLLQQRSSPASPRPKGSRRPPHERGNARPDHHRPRGPTSASRRPPRRKPPTRPEPSHANIGRTGWTGSRADSYCVRASGGSGATQHQAAAQREHPARCARTDPRCLPRHRSDRRTTGRSVTSSPPSSRQKRAVWRPSTTTGARSPAERSNWSQADPWATNTAPERARPRASHGLDGVLRPQVSGSRSPSGTQRGR